MIFSQKEIMIRIRERIINTLIAELELDSIHNRFIHRELIPEERNYFIHLFMFLDNVM